jgi:phytoene synthase
MRILPALLREAIFEIYAFCRAVDDIADGGGQRHECVEQLDDWRRRVDSLYGACPAEGCGGLARAAAEFGLRREDFLSVIDGMEMDVTCDMRAPTIKTLDLYCDRVASAVGRLCVRVFGMDDAEGERLAHHLGRALQLTNILRDLDEDAGMGRLYLPREALVEAGIRAKDPRVVLAHPALDSACRRVAGAAFVHFVEADAVMAAAPRSTVRAPRIMANAYRAILDGLVQRGWSAPRERIGLKRAQLARIALRSLVL